MIFIRSSNALLELVKGCELVGNEYSYMASAVYGENGEFMNVPKINTDKSESGYPDWYQYLENGIVKIKEATFVSLLIKTVNRSVSLL